MTLPHPSSSFAFTARVRLLNVPGMLGRLTTEIGRLGGDMRAIDMVRVERNSITRDVTVHAADAEHAESIVEALHHLDGIEVLEYSDRTFLAHLGGKIAITPKQAIKTRDDLSMVYTPGVARVCAAIAEDHERARALTIKRNCVAIVTDGSAVLGMGNIGPEASLPVMEGKAMLFKEFGGVDAFPICLATQVEDEIVETVQRIAPVFGGIALEDIAAPRCFAVEGRLRATLDIPVFHDDQHGTAITVVAALVNALRVVSKNIEDVRIVVLGVGAAGTACTRLMLQAGARDIVGVDRDGALYRGGSNVRGAAHRWYAAHTNPRLVRGSLDDAITGADVFVGTSSGGVLTRDQVRTMRELPIVFALANPEPEIRPEAIEDVAAVIATGRSDYPNQINNVLAFPGFFRGLLDSGVRRVTDGMKLAAARAIADIVGDALHPEHIVPSVFNRAVAPAVAAAVRAEASRVGLAEGVPKPVDPLHAHTYGEEGGVDTGG